MHIRSRHTHNVQFGIRVGNEAKVARALREGLERQK